ncbi:nucleoside diphosphate kinase regulator [Desulfobotulus sp.]|jgi:regulator of nucleoside diphosphate kinase|uniref:nucleoside diphosphate kinase regulator n=1 Tax=Desulfobotulus sp. TaxID=1940337 RepID=UPI002A35ADE2|nr:nucleoside diphosphate kinase regulator [Desulfobotulus sp.]MDY0164283.1 nucleoside diphosphate kinase regulator [Desulfobotulus sp.]
MQERTIYITEVDLERLERLVEATDKRGRLGEHLDRLMDELDQCRVVEPEHVPADVITMNSRVRLKDLVSGKEAEWTLVFPGKADIAQNRISILAPAGIAMIGLRVGDVVSWSTPDGEKRLRVEAILYQPEAAGDFHL